jgi:hypothetical protein
LKMHAIQATLDGFVILSCTNWGHVSAMNRGTKHLNIVPCRVVTRYNGNTLIPA